MDDRGVWGVQWEAGRERDKRKGGGVTLSQNSNFRKSFVAKAVDNPMAYRDALCEERGGKPGKED